jgi:RHS repeat-associated protein
LSYDAWGRLRHSFTQQVYAPDATPALLLGRGYTGHEHLPWFGLVNMNARLYDPVVGRFLSPDPYVQAPEFSQSFNRYSYCWNNPLRYCDETGEWFLIDDLIAAAAGFVCGYVVHGITTGNWGMKAVAAGGIGAGMAWLGYNTMGGAAAMSGWQFAGNQVVNTAIGMVTPPINFGIGNVNFSISLMSMFTAGAMGNMNGFSLGVGISASYDIGDWTISAGIGGGSKYAGISYNDKNFGFSWHTTKYGGEIDGGSQGQRTATLGLRYKDWSISHENDVALMRGDGGDRYRSAALEIGYKDYMLGVNVYTNDPKIDGVLKGTNQYKNGIQYSSPLYIGKRVGYGMVKVGMEHPAIGRVFQNGFHKLIGSPLLMQSTVNPFSPYIKSGRYFPFSKYY